jgi:hypothetical protein
METRGAFQQWQAKQALNRKGIEWGRWHATGSRPPEASEPNLDLEAKNAQGERLWTARPGWKDGMAFRLDPSRWTKQNLTFYLQRTVTAPQPVTLSIGLGPADRVDVWLNGERLQQVDTRIHQGRYGCSFSSGRAERDLALVDLPLKQAENHLVLRVVQQTFGKNRAVPFRVSTKPRPEANLWECIRCDFPPHEHALLAAVPQSWLEADGWLAATDCRLEREFLASLHEGNAALAAGGESGEPELRQCIRLAEAQRLLADLDRVQAGVDELGRQFKKLYPAPRHSQSISRLRNRTRNLAREATNESVWAGLRRETDALKQAAFVETNPLLAEAKLLFARRYTYNSQHYYDDYYHGISRWGGNLTELDVATRQTRDIVPTLNGGVFDRYDISFDADRVIFGYRRPRPEGFRIWEVNRDGSGLRQLTFPPDDETERIAKHSAYSPEQLEAEPAYYGHWTDDMHPCYLPDGRIAFVSSRCETTVLCGGHGLTCTALYRMNADGSGLYRLSQGALTESTPTVLDDGRILYTRWEYVYKGIGAVQSLWAMNPDGSGSEEVYGHNIDNPGVFFAGRQIPGMPDHVVATGCGHEPVAVGSINMVDRRKDRRSKEAMTSLTPEVETRGLRGFYQLRNGQWHANDIYGPFYCDPYPLAEPVSHAGAGSFFLVSCNETGRYNDQRGYGVYLLDRFGNRTLVYKDPEMSCFQPMVLAPRAVPPALPSKGVETGDEDATVVLTDIYHNMPGVERGTVKYLRVMEQIPRNWEASKRVAPGDGVPGQQTAISLYSHIWVSVMLGVVPVEPDGSAAFKVPSRRNIFFTALDEDFMEIQKMRSFVNLQPGENRSCVGCHDPRLKAPTSHPTMAMQRSPSVIVPQPGDTGPRPLHYPSDVQPIFDRHCVACHGGEKPKGKLDLTGTMTTHFNRSYENLMKGGYVNFIQEWTTAFPQLEPWEGNGSMSHVAAVKPYTYGSHQSKLIKVLRAEHKKVKLAREDFIRLATWVDANAPFYGTYYGRKHVRYKGKPNFRPVPDLASARGIPPPPYTSPPLPAEQIASWKRDELPERFNGANYVQGEPAGSHEAISVALWVHADELKNTWSPLLFTDGKGASSFHFSLLKDGTPNVAVNDGGKTWVHNRANSAVAPGEWHHVAVVCDPRFGGVIRFYLDGRPAGARAMDLGIPLDMTAYRLGAWKNWERVPANNFHGALDDVRVYSGLLTGAEISAIYQSDGRSTEAVAAP